MTTSDEHEILRGSNAFGESGQWSVRTVGEETMPGSVLAVRRVELDDGKPLICLRLPEEGATPQAEWMLDNEIRSAARLTVRYRHNHPHELPKLVGYNFDTRAPFALLSPYPGEAAVNQKRVRSLLNEQRARFAASLARALALLAAVDLVHGSIDLSSIYLDGMTVHLVNFGAAMAVGEARGRTLAHPGDDVLAAARVLYEVYTGHPPPKDKQPDLTDIPIRDLLTGAFAPNPEDRPCAVTLLDGLGGSSSELPRPDDVRARLARGHARFDAERRHKRPVVLPPSSPPDRTLIRALLATVLVVAVVVLALVAFGVF